MIWLRNSNPNFPHIFNNPQLCEFGVSRDKKYIREQLKAHIGLWSMSEEGKLKAASVVHAQSFLILFFSSKKNFLFFSRILILVFWIGTRFLPKCSSIWPNISLRKKKKWPFLTKKFSQQKMRKKTNIRVSR